MSHLVASFKETDIDTHSIAIKRKTQDRYQHHDRQYKARPLIKQMQQSLHNCKITKKPAYRSKILGPLFSYLITKQ
jgi:hypothetical protein